MRRPLSCPRTPAALLLLLLLPAGPSVAQNAAGPATVHMTYSGSALGFEVMQVEAALTSDAAGYRVDISSRTVGLLAAFVRSEQHTTVWGLWRGGRAEPTRFWSWGHLRGAPRVTLIDYQAGQPVVRRLEPPNEHEREEVPERSRAGTVDTLTAVAILIHRVADTGTCDGDERVFDGRRLSVVAVHTVGRIMTANGDAGPYQGEALRCAFIGRQLAGFLLDGPGWAHEPHNGTAWLARAVPGGPPLPVRISFETRWVGEVDLTLTDAGPGPLPTAPR